MTATLMAILSNLRSVLKAGPARSVGIYIFTNFFGKAASFLLLIVFTDPAIMTPAENGLLALFSNSILLLMPFLAMGIVHSTGADFFKLGKDEFRDLFTTAFLMAFVVMLASALLLFFFRHSLYKNYGFPELFTWLIPVMAFFIFCNDQLLNMARNRNDSTIYLGTNVFKVILEVGISFFLVVLFAWHWKGRITGLSVAYLVMAAFGVYYFYKHKFLTGRVRKKYMFSELVYAIPVIALQVGTFCMGSSDRFFLSALINDKNETVGVYNLASAFGSIIIILCTALLQYIFPRIYTELAKGQAVNYSFIGKLFRTYAAIMIAASILIALFTPVAYHFFINERYHSGLKYVFILCGGFFLWTIAWFFFSFLLYFKEKRKILMLSCIFIITSVLFNYFFITSLGVWGAALANISTYLVVLAITLFFTRSYWKAFITKD